LKGVELIHGGDNKVHFLDFDLKITKKETIRTETKKILNLKKPENAYLREKKAL